jgi:hypothetical protein
LFFSGQARRDIEDDFVWLDQYCPEHPKEHLAVATSKRNRKGKSP